MGVHHIALATKDMAATHDFYTNAMGFRIAKTVVAPTDNPGGWAKHVFYEIPGGGQIAFWDLHDEKIGDQWKAGMSTGLGLPWWVNHLAFDAKREELRALGDRWLKWGTDVMKVDHGFVQSIYTRDPNGNSVEWCADIEPYTDEDRKRALADMLSEKPEVGPPYPLKGLWKPERYHPKAVRLYEQG